MSKKASTKGPQFTKYMIPLLFVLRETGGSATASEATDAIIERESISEAEMEQTLKNGQSRVRNRIAWARQYLVYAGYIDSSTRGVWSLTEKGLQEDLSVLSGADLYKKVHATLKGLEEQTKETEILTDLAGEETIIETKENNLLLFLRSISPAGFERLCQRLLREHGFQQVKITGKSGDCGIDGEGILEINPLISFKVIFQCKRFQGTVGSPVVRDFRGAMAGRADKGIIITTGSFSMDAKREAVRDGAPPIDLVDGEKLVKMFEALELGVKPHVVYKIDHEFFKEYE